MHRLQAVGIEARRLPWLMRPGLTAARSIAWPPTMPGAPGRRRDDRDHAQLRAISVGVMPCGSRASRRKAFGLQPVARENRHPVAVHDVHVGRPRRSSSSSIAGRSSWISE